MADERLSFLVKSIGCKANQYEVDVTAAQLLRLGFIRHFGDEADICIVNSCTVTSEAGRKSRQLLRRLRKINPAAIIVVMGCESELNDLTDLADLCFGTAGRNLIAAKLLELLNERGFDLAFLAADAREFAIDLARKSCEREAKNSYEDAGVAVVPTDSRAQLKICDGCNNICSYCSIRLARGAVRSRALGDIIAEAESYLEQGFREIVLTGIQICSYGVDLKEEQADLLAVLRELGQMDKLLRVRLGSLDPSCLDLSLLEEMAKIENLCDHFHLSLQSGSDAVLKRMRRKYDSKKFKEVAFNLLSYWPAAALTTDIICGFPAESEEEHRESLNFCEEIAFARMHVFPFSCRPGTEASRLPDQLPAGLAKERAAEMNELGLRLTDKFCLARIGSRASVLFEREVSPAMGEGYSSNYLPCRFNLEGFKKTAAPGDIFELILEDYLDGYLQGRVISCH